MALHNAKARCAAVVPISYSSTTEAHRIVHNVLNPLQENDLISDVPVLSTHLPHIGQYLGKISKQEDQSLALVSFGKAVQVDARREDRTPPRPSPRHPRYRWRRRCG